MVWSNLNTNIKSRFYGGFSTSRVSLCVSNWLPCKLNKLGSIKSASNTLHKCSPFVWLRQDFWTQVVRWYLHRHFKLHSKIVWRYFLVLELSFYVGKLTVFQGQTWIKISWKSFLVERDDNRQGCLKTFV